MTRWNRAGWLVMAAAGLLAGCTTGEPEPAGPAGTPVSGAATSGAPTAAAPSPSGPCTPKVVMQPLPDWADAGFSGDTTIAHTLGERGEIAAILFANPLTHDRKDGANNKILWVSREPNSGGEPLKIIARLDGRGQPVAKEVPGGPGPSIIDMPGPGCWRMELTWAGHTDWLDLVYAAG
ncbi:hypothetical protein ACFQY4_05555 [Catellatospora bangladeshensis]|uniref:Lipoprotein n=1 Tax=Catellatospora bangladeshensis TaxID=310355 RepID=A0A8J3JM87_9ACTN|nr:hypothetical protein [Catellatospora bangladeshensis]GIF83168.1 hypothetical protein Cba03nite_45170 [Catellatospora bangladeshensis]